MSNRSPSGREGSTNLNVSPFRSRTGAIYSLSALDTVGGRRIDCPQWLKVRPRRARVPRQKTAGTRGLILNSAVDPAFARLDLLLFSYVDLDARVRSHRVLGSGPGASKRRASISICGTVCRADHQRTAPENL